MLTKPLSKYVKKIAAYQDTVALLTHNALWYLRDQVLFPLVTNYGTIADFATHPDHTSVAFLSNAEGGMELFLSQSGETPRRLTFFSDRRLSIAGWTDEGIFVKTFHDSYCKHVGPVHKVCPKTGLSERVNLGHTIEKVSQFGNRIVLQRCGYGYARWREYAGGTKGELWIGMPGTAKVPLADAADNTELYTKLLELKNNIVSPLAHQDRVYFLNDGDGVGNVYSCDPTGTDIKQHTQCKDYYVESVCFVGDSLYYISGGTVFCTDPQGGIEEVQITQAQNSGRRAALSYEGVEYLSSFTVSERQEIATIIRGHLYKSDPHLCSSQLGADLYRNVCWLNKDQLLAVTNGKSPSVHRIDREGCVTKISDLDIGIVHDLVPNHDGTKVLVTNNRHQLWLWELGAADGEPGRFTTTKLVEHSKLPPSAPAWSPDGAWIAYEESLSAYSTVVKLFNTTTKQTIHVTSSTDRCTDPVFDAKGKYLFFTKLVAQNSAEQLFDFPGNATCCGYRLCMVTLDSKDSSLLTGSCIVSEKEDADNDKKGEGDKEGKKDSDTPPETVITDGLQHRIEEFPSEFDADGIRALGCSEKGPVWIERASQGRSVKQYLWSTGKAETLATGVCAADYNDSWTAYLTDDHKLITCKSGEKLSDNPTEVRPDLGGVWKLPVVQIDTQCEWQAIYTEAWYLAKEHFYDGKETAIDWDALYEKYLKLVNTATSRTDLNHIIYQMKGELKSSHAFVLEAGDVDTVGRTTVSGSLGAQIEWDGTSWVFKRCYGADLYGEVKSPLARFGLQPGTKILQIAGKTLTQSCSPEAALTGVANQPVQVKIQAGGDKPQILRTNSIAYDPEVHYKEWVAKKRTVVGEEFGYIHIPDMDQHGLTYFYQQYRQVFDKPGLIIDIRNNSGGHVSTLIVSTLINKRLGVDMPKYHAQDPYMALSPRGPMVLLVNQYTASDGDIFAQAFKDLKLGPVIGKRTWGGVIGIMPRYTLLDNGMTSQPEFAYKFDSVGFSVEGGGVAPDIEVDSRVESELDGTDYQLLRGMAELQLIINRGQKSL